MLKVISIALVAQFLALTSAFACEGQTGKVIFEDKFTDDSGGWDFTPPFSTVKPPAFVFALAAEHFTRSAQNLTFQATQADFCLDAILPKPVAADNNSWVGIEFWATDYDNFKLLQLSAKGQIALFNRANGKWQRIFSVLNAPGFKSEPDAANTLRINTIGGKLTAYLNGTKVKVVRAQIPSGNMRFGIYAQWDKGAPTLPIIKVTSFKVTTGQ